MDLVIFVTLLETASSQLFGWESTGKCKGFQKIDGTS